MAKRITKRQKLILEKVVPNKIYAFAEAIELLQQLPLAKFKKTAESVDVSLNLGIDTKKSEQTVRGSTVLPNGTGKTVRVAVFTQGPNVEKAKAAGADIVGMADLAEQIQAGNIDFDVVIASPDAMGVVGKLGQVLGPRGLMPNPKVGTVTADVAKAVANAKAGQVRYRADKGGIVHCTIGKINFTVDALRENLEALLSDLRKAKPSSSKGVYMKKLNISTTMGPGLVVDISSLNF
jgi:large subunit ribosomal protein L1